MLAYRDMCTPDPMHGCAPHACVQGIDYNEFIAAFSGGGGGNGRFMPEFMKPKSLRGSQLGHPWEWRGGPKYFGPSHGKVGVNTALANSAVTLERLATAKGHNK